MFSSELRSPLFCVCVFMHVEPCVCYVRLCHSWQVFVCCHGNRGLIFDVLLMKGFSGSIETVYMPTSLLLSLAFSLFMMPFFRYQEENVIS